MTEGSSARLAASPARLDTTDLSLFAVIVLVWGASWIALTSQLGVVSPEVSTLWRFLIAAVLMWAWVLVRGERMSVSARDHAYLAVTGALLFSTNFVAFLYAGAYLPSGLMAVVFSLASIVNLILGALFLRQPVQPRVALGGVCGVLGVALIYWPQVAGAGFDRGAVAGLALCLVGTLSFCLGNLASSFIQRRGIAMLPATAWGMTYGALALAVVSLMRGQAFIIEPSVRYIASLLYLAFFASVVAFACYLRLLREIGSARAAYVTVLMPVVALAISTVLEGYRWTLPALVGVGLTLFGNLLVLRRA